MIRPPALQTGDMIGVFAPSCRVDRQAAMKAAETLEKAGYKIWFHPQTWAEHGSFAGTGRDKAQAFHDLLQNPEIKAIIGARGGNGAGQMLKYLDFELIKNHPKIIIGYSDVTALLNAVTAKTGLVTFHGPVLQRIDKTGTETELRQTIELLNGGTLPTFMEGTVMANGTASGHLLGGNLSVFCSLLGTAWQPDTEGAILFLEDCSDQLSRFDRYFTQLLNAGILADISGLILGDFTIEDDTGTIPFGFTLEECIAEYMAEFDIPVVTNAPFGHSGNLMTLPIGAQATLTADKTIKLEVADAVVSGK